MQIRYLASVAGVHCAVPLRDQLSNLITTTQYIADRNIYAAVLNRQQWDKLREEYWATGRQCDHGRLVPDIDFIASDGKSFLDFEACRKHEESLAGAIPTTDLDKFNIQCLLSFKAVLMRCVDSKQATLDVLQEQLDYIRKVEGIETAPAYNSGMVLATDEQGNVVGAVGIRAMTEGFGIKTTPDGPPVTLTTDSAPQTLEDRMLVVVGSNYMNIGLVASLLKTDENAVRAVAESSGKFKLSGTGKSIAKN